MFTYKELYLIDKGYFKVLKYPVEDNYIVGANPKSI